MILLSQPYAGYTAGSVVSLQTNVELALIAQNRGVANAGPVTPGNTVANEVVGRCAVPAAGVSVVITNNLVNADSRVFAIINQATADTTAFNVDWALVLTAGKTSLP